MCSMLGYLLIDAEAKNPVINLKIMNPGALLTKAVPIKSNVVIKKLARYTGVRP